MSTGWIKLNRSIQENWLWEEKPFDKKSAWIDLLLMANHKNNKFPLGNEIIEVEQGSFITSEIKLMNRWGWSKTKLRNFLKLLESEKMITKVVDRKKTTISIVNYKVYQGSEDQEKTTEKPQEDQEKTIKKPQEDTNKNDNNEKNENNIIYMDLSFIDDCITNVKITQEQYNKLKDKFNIELLHDKIIALDVYKDLKKYKDHYKVLNIWCRKEKDNPKYQEKPKADYSYLKPKEPPAWVVDWS